MSLPLAWLEDLGPQVPALEADGDRTYRVLVVDAYPDAAETLALLVRLWGYHPAVAHDGLAALMTAAAFQPAAVLTDVVLPVLNGYEVARRLRQLPGLADVLLVALTGYAREEDRRWSHEAGFDHHLLKTVDFAVLQGLLARRTRECGVSA
jgi:CheY-like chemotaxis protein